MATEVRLPQFGMGMQEGKLLHWFKHEGEQVQEGEPLCEVEAEKAVVEVPSPFSGLLTRIIVEVDRTVPVLEVLALIEPYGQAPTAEPNAPDSRAEQARAGAIPHLSLPSTGSTSKEGSRNVHATPLAQRVAKDHGIDIQAIKGTGPGGRITDQDVRRTIANPARIAPSRPSPQDRAPQGDVAVGHYPASGTVSVQVEPRARRLASQHGIDLSLAMGTGPGGRITEDDVRQIVEGSATQAPEPVAASAPVAPMEDAKLEQHQVRVIPLTGMRGAIARRMLQSLQSSAQLTLVSEADVTELVKRRESLTRQFDLSYTDLLIKAAALALRRHPRLNAIVVGDEIRVLAEINIGVAIALDDGLVVPVVRSADSKPLITIADEVAQYVQRARRAKLTMTEITGGSFTVTNLGSFGIDAFTPILNPPEAAILGVGRIVERLSRRDSDLVWRQTMMLSLTVDHRAVDGSPAAAFLQSLRELLAQPELIIQET
jgi:pyruvate dehydrogenase E2 component (dihydrolipoamide acetyltransferase)